jgi:hypothetical protein
MNGLQSISEWEDYFGNPAGSVLGVVNAAQSIGSVLSLPFVRHHVRPFWETPYSSLGEISFAFRYLLTLL